VERWEFPGGKVEDGETHAQAAIRELQEELDVRVNVKDVQFASFQSYPWYDRNLVRTLFTVDGFSGTVKSQENQKFRWVGLDELKDFDFMSADEVFAEWVINHYTDKS
jgi:8-oxo-dGTP diphosphatase